MKKGENRFIFYLDKIQELLFKAERQKNPGLWLYQNNLRTSFFMLEGLAKMYTSFHNKKKFSKLEKQFKELEDVIGAIDYYDAFHKECMNNKTMPEIVTNYLSTQTKEKIQSFNQLLREEKWIKSNKDRIVKLRKKLSGIDWLNEEKEIKKLEAFYHSQIKEIKEFTTGLNFHFNNVETDVHELRRKLRWLSIYPQAFQGCIQLWDAEQTPDSLTKYLTEDITTSPYNVMPNGTNSSYFLLLSKKHFLALSWLIAELGKLKDNGLRIIVIKEALLQTALLTDENSISQTYQILGKDYPSLKILLDDAGRICKTFFDEKVLDGLVIGVAKSK